MSASNPSRQAKTRIALLSILGALHAEPLVYALNCLRTIVSEHAAWDLQNQALAESILDVTRRDPGRRVLVSLLCQRFHKLRLY